jgi:hypothetical protein
VLNVIDNKTDNAKMVNEIERKIIVIFVAVSILVTTLIITPINIITPEKMRLSLVVLTNPSVNLLPTNPRR